jgi:MipA family protein
MSKINRFSKINQLLSVILFTLPTLALAESKPYNLPDLPFDEAKKNTANAPDEWKTTIGLGFGYGSIYQGGAERKFYPIPVLEASYGNWNLGFSGLRYSFINTDELQLGVGLGYDFGRRDKNLPKKFRGLGDVDGGLTTSVFANYQVVDFLALSLDISKSQADSDSLLVNAGANSVFPIYGESLLGNIGLNAIWANEDHMSTYYGVNASQSAKTKLKRYKADSGLEKVTLSTGITYLIDKSWTYSAAIGVESYQGDAKDSPVIEDKTQPFFFNTISYSF